MVNLTTNMHVQFSMDGPAVEVKLAGTVLSVDNKTEIIELDQEHFDFNLRKAHCITKTYSVVVRRPKKKW